MIKKAHENGIRVNFFWEDDPKEAVALFEAGVDCVLTNDLLAVKNALDEK
jgi:glycerophosphoryl diester phosphodiesterase